MNRTLFVAENAASSRTKDDEEDKYKLFAKALGERVQLRRVLDL